MMIVRAPTNAMSAQVGSFPVGIQDGASRTIFRGGSLVCESAGAAWVAIFVFVARFPTRRRIEPGLPAEARHLDEVAQLVTLGLEIAPVVRVRLGHDRD